MGKKNDLTSYLQVGLALMVTVDSKLHKGHSLTIVRGWTPNQYLLCEFGDPKNIPNIGKEDVCTAHLISEGTVCAFESTVLDLGTKEFFSFIRLSWPKDFKIKKVRKQERSNIDVPCQVTIMETDETITAHMGDISTGGCMIRLKQSLPKGSEISISFTLPNGLHLENVTAEVRNVRHVTGNQYQVGCQFKSLDGDSQIALEIAIAYLLFWERKSGPSCQWVLSIGPNCERMSTLQKQLLETYNTELLCSYHPVSGIAIMGRRKGLAAMLLAEKLPGCTGEEISRIVRHTPQFETLPIYILTDNPPAPESGATGHFPETSSPEVILEKLSVHLTEGNSSPTAPSSNPTEAAHT